MRVQSFLKILKNYCIIFLQVLTLIVVGITTNDNWYMICISVLGILYNYCVSIGRRFSFIIGGIYALLYGLMSYFENIYASAFFMIVVQLPSAIISYITWGRSGNETNLKSQNIRQLVLTFISLIALTIVIYYVLKLLNGSGALFDSFFFACSFIACVLLMTKYREAYIVILLSGVGGSALWLYQFITTTQGISVFLLNLFVLINAIIAIVLNYVKKKGDSNKKICEDLSSNNMNNKQ